MQASFYIIVRNSFSITSPFVVHTHGSCDCPGYPGPSGQSDGHVGGQHDVSENAPYAIYSRTEYFCEFGLGGEIRNGLIL